MNELELVNNWFNNNRILNNYTESDIFSICDKYNIDMNQLAGTIFTGELDPLQSSATIEAYADEAIRNNDRVNVDLCDSLYTIVKDKYQTNYKNIKTI